MDVSLSLRGAVIGNITGSIMDIGRSLRRAIIRNIWLRYRVDQASVKSIVSQGEGSIWESIRIGTQAIPVRKNYRGSCILRSRGTKCYTNKGEKSQTLHV